jgi:hypothetical protein
MNETRFLTLLDRKKGADAAFGLGDYEGFRLRYIDFEMLQDAELEATIVSLPTMNKTFPLGPRLTNLTV